MAARVLSDFVYLVWFGMFGHWLLIGTSCECWIRCI